ncbi:MAG: type II toxin-antitoxin system RelE/ParE family toxin [Alphaproteobacteria bacterium]|nr:type II toxin-antitoxin system RelE/ParE family toxin [Alphaproteobacteria bacterium]
MEYAVEEYVTPKGTSPFSEWLNQLKDNIAVAKIMARIDRAAHGNFGDWKSLAGTKGIFEMRETHGGGYRIYYSLIGRKLFYFWQVQQKKIRKK